MIGTIRNLFANNLCRDDNMKKLMTHPHPKEVLNLLPDHKDKIVDIKGYFGRGEFGEYQYVSQRIAENMAMIES
jgi:hypothetical protein